MKLNRIVHVALGIACFASLGALFNDEFLQCAGQKTNLPTAPGDADFVLVRMENPAQMAPNTGIGWSLQWRLAGQGIDGTGVGGTGLTLGEDIGVVVPCNITAITAGSLDDPTQPGAWLIYNPPLDPVEQPLRAFGETLQNGIHFRCGDTLTFLTVNDGSLPERYKIMWLVASGQAQTGPFSGPQAFEIFEREVAEHEQDFAFYIANPPTIP